MHVINENKKSLTDCIHIDFFIILLRNKFCCLFFKVHYRPPSSIRS